MCEWKSFDYEKPLYNDFIVVKYNKNKYFIGGYFQGIGEPKNISDRIYTIENSMPLYLENDIKYIHFSNYNSPGIPITKDTFWFKVCG